MATFKPGETVCKTAEASTIVGTVLETSDADGGLRPVSALDPFDDTDTPERGLVPVRWFTIPPYEWWEDPDTIAVVSVPQIPTEHGWISPTI